MNGVVQLLSKQVGLIGELAQVLKNLELALQQLWRDPVCINRKDDEESHGKSNRCRISALMRPWWSHGLAQLLVIAT